jgi:hypothetical protein
MDLRALALAQPPLPARDVRRIHGRRRAPERPPHSLPPRALHGPPRGRRRATTAARAPVGNRPTDRRRRPSGCFFGYTLGRRTEMLQRPRSTTSARSTRSKACADRPTCSTGRTGHTRQALPRPRGSSAAARARASAAVGSGSRPDENAPGRRRLQLPYLLERRRPLSGRGLPRLRRARSARGRRLLLPSPRARIATASPRLILPRRRNGAHPGAQPSCDLVSPASRPLGGQPSNPRAEVRLLPGHCPFHLASTRQSPSSSKSRSRATQARGGRASAPPTTPSMSVHRLEVVLLHEVDDLLV